MAAKEMFYTLDDRFSHLERSDGRLVDQLNHWLPQQPWVYIEEDHQPADTRGLRSLIPDPPSREERLAARLRRRPAENHGALMSFIHRLRD